MFRAANLEAAARYAEELLETPHLFFVEPRSRYAVRLASRKETGLLQRFLAACNRSNNRLHLRTDLDALLERRQDLVFSFFMGLYLAPVHLRAHIENAEGNAPGAADHTGGSGNGASGGSGGRHAPHPEHDFTDASSEDTPQGSRDTDGAAAIADPHAAPSAPHPAEAPGAGAPPGSESQTAALAEVLTTSAASDADADREIDLGEF